MRPTWRSMSLMTPWLPSSIHIHMSATGTLGVAHGMSSRRGSLAPEEALVEQ